MVTRWAGHAVLVRHAVLVGAARACCASDVQAAEVQPGPGRAGHDQGIPWQRAVPVIRGRNQRIVAACHSVHSHTVCTDRLTCTLGRGM